MNASQIYKLRGSRFILNLIIYKGLYHSECSKTNVKIH